MKWYVYSGPASKTDIWFAWHPVKAITEQHEVLVWVWLEKVKRDIYYGNEYTQYIYHEIKE